MTLLRTDHLTRYFAAWDTDLKDGRNRYPSDASRVEQSTPYKRTVMSALKTFSSMTRLPSSLVAAFALVSALAACGGGGSAPAPAPTPTPAPPPPPPPSPINTVRPPSTYAAASAEKVAFELLNDERGACGFGFLKQSAALDAASADTGAYFAARAGESRASAFAYSHLQDPAKTMFTGQLPSDRARFRSYAGTVPLENEGNAFTGFQPASSQTDIELVNRLMTDLLTSAYHVKGLMDTTTDVGIAYTRVTSADGWDLVRVNLDRGLGTGALPQIGSTVRTYPCQGTTRVRGTFKPQTESPNPAPDLGAATIGTPIYVNAPEGQTLLITTATVTSTAGSVPVRVLSRANDPIFAATGIYSVEINQSYLLPLNPLTMGATYTVTISGTSNGAAFNTAFAFTPSL